MEGIEHHQSGCPTCGAPLHLSKGESILCPECGMPVNISEEDDDLDYEEADDESGEEWE